MRTAAYRLARFLTAFAFYALAIATSAKTGAQTTYTAQTDAKLQTVVQLSLGETTAKAVAEALSRQTGLRVDVADYLSDRVLIVEISDCSARAALDALAACNDWTWSEGDNNRLSIRRRASRTPASPAAVPRRIRAAVPRRIRAALPADLRAFLDFPTPSDDLTKFESTFFGDPNSGKRLEAAANARVQASKKLHTALTAIMPDLLKRGQISCGDLNPAQQEAIASQLVFQTFSNTQENLLHSDLMPHVADPNRAFLRLDGKNLYIGSEFYVNGVSGGSGFAGPLHPETP